MKRTMILMGALIALGSTQVGCTKEDETTLPVNLPSTTLTDAEKDGLIQMREEEKLARDVYLYSLDLYPIQIFGNISNSEQKHMDRILTLLNTYGIADPASTEQGVFNDPKIQQLYDDLTTKSSLSRLDALIVGATIEDLDIYDLDVLMIETDKTDITMAYEFLNCGSRNHLRAFNSQVESNGGTYTAQYLSTERYNDILAGSHENCGE